MGWFKAKHDKNIKESITTSLVQICNRSFETGIIPSELKIANVVPIYKSGDEMVFLDLKARIRIACIFKTIGETCV